MALFLMLVGFFLISSMVFFYIHQQQKKYLTQRFQELQQHMLNQTEIMLSQTHQKNQLHLSEQMSQNQLSIQKLIAENVGQQMQDTRAQIQHSFKQHADALTSHLQTLKNEVHTHLSHLTQHVHQQLDAGFEKTSATFNNVLTRLTIIDEAQKKITELSNNVVSLQDILIDKRARGAFGEVQLSALIANMIPSNHYRLQHTLSNQKRADCMLFLPKPTGNVAIDAKFPLETYQKLTNNMLDNTQKKGLQQQFRQDLLKHIKDIASKYIIPPETADGAVMFIPAEAIFAEIHANYPELITLAQRLKVWLVSPSTLMAVLTTARAVLKDDATKKQVHIIQKHLQALALDFQRFEKRMDNLSKHIEKAHQDVGDVSISAKKITQRFHKIETVNLLQEESELIE